MKKIIALRSMLAALPSLAAFLVLAISPAPAADEEDHTIVPGIGLGMVKLGMSRDLVKKTAGNKDGSYTLPSGVAVEFAEWKENPPKQSPNLRFFYTAEDKLVQVNSAAPVPATADGISCGSTREQVYAKYKNLKCFEYRGKNGRIDYCDDIAHGIAFEFTRANGAKAEQLYAIIVHLPGQRVLADRDEKPLAIKSRVSK